MFLLILQIWTSKEICLELYRNIDTQLFSINKRRGFKKRTNLLHRIIEESQQLLKIKLLKRFQQLWVLFIKENWKNSRLFTQIEPLGIRMSHQLLIVFCRVKHSIRELISQTISTKETNLHIWKKDSHNSEKETNSKLWT